VHLALNGLQGEFTLFLRLGTALLAATIGLPALAAVPQNASITPRSRPIDITMAHNILNVGLASSDPDVRARAIAAVGMIARTQSVRKRIEGFLSDKNEHVRIAAVDTLADLHFHRSIPALEKVMNNDPVPEVEFAAAKALFKLGDPKGKQMLEVVLYGKLDTKSSYIERQKRKFFSHFYSVQRATIYLIDQGSGFVPVPGVGMGLSEAANLMDDQGLSPRATIVLMLGRQKDPGTDNLLKFALKDSDWSVRASAVLMIALTARQELREDLVPLMSDSDARVRFRAAGAYLHLVGAHAAPPKN
jgi:HEAT repeat protein